MSDLSQRLEDDLLWREAELASLKAVARSAVHGSTRHKALLRALGALLYAHYEGFCKYAWQLYLDALKDESVPRKVCVQQLACLSLRKYFKKLKGSGSDEDLWHFFSERFDELMSAPLEFDDDIIETGNLSPPVFRAIAKELGVPCPMVDAHDVTLQAMVHRRHAIAHGEKMIVNTLSEYAKYEHAAQLVMHELAVAILENLEEKKYLRYNLVAVAPV